jgi:hypothetical protein
MTKRTHLTTIPTKCSSVTFAADASAEVKCNGSQFEPGCQSNFRNFAQEVIPIFMTTADKSIL